MRMGIVVFGVLCDIAYIDMHSHSLGLISNNIDQRLMFWSSVLIGLGGFFMMRILDFYNVFQFILSPFVFAIGQVCISDPRHSFFIHLVA
jgi:hypothetical protein